MAAPTPLLAHSINLTLQFLTLSQREAEPLSPHLISKPLLQRHHFLQLSPDDPSSYLSWPSDTDTETGIIGNLLQSYIPPVDDTQYSNYPVRYTSDTETTCAHVHILPLVPYTRITPGRKASNPALSAEHDNPLSDGQLGSTTDPALRLVFLWDHQDGSWKYHDAGLMPFPPHSYSSLVDALSSTNTMSRLHEDFLDDPSLVPDPDQGEDEDAYWAAYGQQNHDGEDQDDDERWPQQDPKPGVPEKELSEDAYWAQYSIVHGSGDSTIPSPIPNQGRKFGHPPSVPLVINSRSISQTEPLSTRPCPKALTERLNALPPRPRSPPPHHDDDSSRSHHDHDPPREIVDLSAQDRTDSASDESLRDTIRGVYQLWRRGRAPAKANMNGGNEGESRVFLDLVREAVADDYVQRSL